MDDDDSLEVAERLDEAHLVVRGDDEHRKLLAPGLDERCSLLRRRLVECGLVDDGQRALGRVRAERASQSGAVGLAVHLDRVAARLWRECDAAAHPLWGADRARARAAGSLLPPRPPATSPRLFADCVPARRAFSSARTAS